MCSTEIEKEKQKKAVGNLLPVESKTTRAEEKSISQNTLILSELKPISRIVLNKTILLGRIFNVS